MAARHSLRTARGRGVTRWVRLVPALVGLFWLVGAAQSAGPHTDAGSYTQAASPIQIADSPTRQVLTDVPPTVLAVTPAPDAMHVPAEASLTVTFSEPVTLAPGALELTCTLSQQHQLTPTTTDSMAYAFEKAAPFLPGDSCLPIIRAEKVTDHDDPPQRMAMDYTWEFHVQTEVVIINEVDAQTAEGATDFIELYDGGEGNTDLNGLVVVFYRGDEATVYLAISLNGYQTDADGYFVLGTRTTPGADLLMADDTLRDGPDAVAVYDALESAFPIGTPLTTEGLLDAVVYGEGADSLLPLLLPGELSLDEGARGDALSDSVGRCPSGEGHPRATSAFAPRPPTPDGVNRCLIDDAPSVAVVSPADDATGLPPDVVIEVTFSEPVVLHSQPIEIVCQLGGIRAYALAGGLTEYRFLPILPLLAGDQCEVTVFGDRVSDADDDDPPNWMNGRHTWSFSIARPVAQGVLINEVDADTPGADTAEFIELFDGGGGHTSLDGMLVVLFNGSDDRSYRTIDLEGFQTDTNGYFLLGNVGVTGVDVVLADGLLQNGADAVALVAGAAQAYPNGTPITATLPIDAVVYGPADQPDAGLLTLLNAGQPQIDEDGRDDDEGHSNQRCPNGGGGARQTAGFRQNTPTPRAASDCITDTAPSVTARVPQPNATGVSPLAHVVVTFNEPVDVRRGWAAITCSASGTHDYTTSGDTLTFTLRPSEPFERDETCTVSLKARYITDLDTDDPPDRAAGNVSWQFKIAGPVADFVVINELDSDTLSSDTAEFIELFDGGVGQTDLSGLTLVFYNGSTNSVYKAFDLDGQHTNAAGYWVAGNAAVNPALVFADGTLQNGPDAVALYAADAAQFPTDAPVTIAGLIDAVVYGDPTATPPGLLPLLLGGEAAANEAGRGAADSHALQRCPNGAGGQRRTAAFIANTPTPGAPSACITDEPPRVIAVEPENGASAISIRTNLAITFSEPVVVAPDWLRLTCELSGAHVLTITGGPATFGATASRPLAYSETCTGRVVATLVGDADTSDPPHQPSADFVWTFTTSPEVASFVLINELDSDTPGSDTAEFIELYDGGRGNTSLAGLSLVLVNGNDDRSYGAYDLDDVRTDGRGLAVIGNSGVAGVSLTLPPGAVQNGADAVALVEGNADEFPNGAAVAAERVIDAIVYGTGDDEDAGLLPLLLPGERQVDEGARGAADTDSSQRCPDGAGGKRRTAGYRQSAPTPGAPNSCRDDAAPAVQSVSPRDGVEDVSPNASLSVEFSEAVALQPGWHAIECESSGTHTASVAGGPAIYTLTPHQPFLPGEMCQATLYGALIRDVDSDDPPDTLAADYRWAFSIVISPPDHVFLNELDADTPGSDSAEFIELYDGGVGYTNLSGLVVVFWNGNGDTVYRAIDLLGRQTDAQGYFVLGNPGLTASDLTFANASLQNGPDAVALYAGRAADFPSGASLTTNGLIDAIVYGATDQSDEDLLSLLLPGQAQVDEGGRGAADLHALQRCPNGAGGFRKTTAYRPEPPTPGTANVCRADEPPAVSAVTPADGATNVSLSAPLVVEFSEAVTTEGQWYNILCDKSGEHSVTVTGGPIHFTLSPLSPFQAGERCGVTLRATHLHDADTDDPPDNPTADYSWDFQTALPPSTNVLINELDADTPDSDTAEFIELYDGGVGYTKLSGLVVVFWNGNGDTAYRAIDLDGEQTDEEGYFVLGNPGLAASDLTFGNASLQNGPDAVALYAGQAADFPAGTALTIIGLIDAVVYGAGDQPDEELRALLLAEQDQVDEGGRGAADQHALQRCPNGAGGPRVTETFRAGPPTPGNHNVCLADVAPSVLDVHPNDGAIDVSPSEALIVEFSEAVTIGDPWYDIQCDTSGAHAATAAGGPQRYTLAPLTPLAPGERCRVTLRATHIHDADTDDPPDSPAADYTWSFRTAPPVAANVLINELDANTPGNDTAEFIELYDGGVGHTDLTGLAIVLWNGKSDTAYRVIDLSAQETDAAGFFVLGSNDLDEADLKLPRGSIQNGADAVGLYDATRIELSPGLALTTAGLLDAVVYGSADSPDDELLALLEAGQPQRDEDGRGAAETHSLQRCPNGAGGFRRTIAYSPDTPTPARVNSCTLDTPPQVTELWPAPASTNVPLTVTLRVAFNEPITLDEDWIDLACLGVGAIPVTVDAQETAASVRPEAPLPPGTECEAFIHAARVHDRDGDDPPDTPFENTIWRFQTRPEEPPPPVAQFIHNGPVRVGETVVFTNTSTGPQPLTFTWDFGDGTSSDGVHATHIYTNPGTYTVSLSAIGAETAVYRDEVIVHPLLLFFPFVGAIESNSHHLEGHPVAAIIQSPPLNARRTVN